MRALTFEETEELRKCLEFAIGSSWVGLTQFDNLFLLTLSRGFWVIDFSGSNAICLPFETLPVKFKSVTKPLILFAKAHLAGAELVSVMVPEGAGRVIQTEWSVTNELSSRANVDEVDLVKRMEIRLIPNQKNLILESEGKKISFAKVLPLSGASHNQNENPPRTLEELKADWIAERGGGLNSSTGTQGVKEAKDDRLRKLKEEMAKKESTIAKVQNQIDQYSDSIHRELGLWLQSHGSNLVPKKFEKHIDNKLSWQQNMQLQFAAAKKEEFKKERTQKRLEWLEQELRDQKQLFVRFEKGEMVPNTAKSRNVQSIKNLNPKNEGAKFKRWQFKEDLLVEMGRNGSENLALLRAAKSWDLWLHIKDQPGSHLIVHRNKQRKILDSELLEIAQWFLRQSLGRTLGDKKTNSLGLAYSLLCTEVRFVSPIKGDHLGRVNYRNERVLKVKMESKDPLDRSDA